MKILHEKQFTPDQGFQALGWVLEMLGLTNVRTETKVSPWGGFLVVRIVDCEVPSQSDDGDPAKHRP
jgi:hypothetical protein